MFLIILFIVLAALYSFLLNLIPVSNWFLFLWIPLGIVLSFVTIILFIVIFLALCPKDKPTGKVRHFLLGNISFIAVHAVNIKITKEGFENIPRDKNFVVYANHKSMMDPLCLYYSMKTRITAMGKKELFNTWIMKKVKETFKAGSVDRENDRAAAKEMIEAIKSVKGGLPMIIFPEGGIKTRDVEEMVDLKAGAYKLATKANAYILPVSIIGSSEVSRLPFYKRKRIKIIFHAPIAPEEYKGKNTTEIGSRVEAIINEGIKRG